MKRIALLLAVTVAPMANAQSLSFSEVIDACQNPAKYQNQVAPKNLQITCEEHSTRWVPTPSKAIEMSRTRQITASLESDKYSVAPNVQQMDVDSQRAACPTFKEVMEHVAFTKATSCEELLEFKGTETDFCTGVIDDMRQQNPNSIQITDTGNTMDLCTGEVGEQGERGQRDKVGERGQRDKDKVGERGQRDQIRDRGQRDQEDEDMIDQDEQEEAGHRFVRNRR